jgi:hypothetical protein
MLIQYINKGKKRKGIMVAFVEKGIDKVYIGWSLCHPKDNFNKYTGQDIAMDRAVKWFYSTKDRGTFIPISIENEVYKFIVRAERYYKNLEYPNWVKEFRKYIFWSIRKG